jgi:hypothetical protein
MIEDGLIVKFKGDATDLARASNSAVTSLNKIGVASEQAAVKAKTNFTGLNRVIQDLPFGFIAISNNLEQVLPAAGAAGLALSTLVSVLSFATIGFSNWTRGLGGTTKTLEDQVKAVNDAKTALSNYVTLLSDVSKVQVVGSQNAQEELVKLQTLYRATQDNNISLADRKKLVDELQSQYPKYFQNISDETILAGGATSAYNRLASAILAAAKARAGQDIIQETQKDIIVNEQQIADARADFEKKTAKASQEQARHNKFMSQGAHAVGEEAFSYNKLANAQRAAEAAYAKVNSLVAQNTALNMKAQTVQAEVSSIVEKNPTALINPTGNTKTPHVKKEVVLDLRVRHINFIAPDDFFARDPATTFKINQDFQKVVAASLENIPIKPRVNIAPDVALITPDEALLQAKILAFTEQVNSMLTAAGGEMAAAFGQTLGDIFSGKGLTSAFSNIANVLGGFIQDLGKLLIKNAIEIQLFKKALAGLIANPALALAVGIGLVAVGGIIKNSVPSVPKFAKGGLATGATLGLIGEGVGTSAANPEVVAPLDKLKNFLAPQSSDLIPQIVFHEITGDTLRLWIQRADKKGGRY